MRLSPEGGRQEEKLRRSERYRNGYNGPAISALGDSCGFLIPLYPYSVKGLPKPIRVVLYGNST
jgi:hypothetical protein